MLLLRKPIIAFVVSSGVMLGVGLFLFNLMYSADYNFPFGTNDEPIELNEEEFEQLKTYFEAYNRAYILAENIRNDVAKTHNLDLSGYEFIPMKDNNLGSSIGRRYISYQTTGDLLPHVYFNEEKQQAVTSSPQIRQFCNRYHDRPLLNRYFLLLYPF